MMRSCKCFSHMTKMSTFTYNCVSSFVVKTFESWTLCVIYINFVRCNKETLLTLNENLIANNIVRYLCASDRIFSTRCWYSPYNILKDKMKRFFKNPWLNRLELWRLWPYKLSEYKLQARTLIILSTILF